MKKSFLALSLVCGFIPAGVAQVANPVYFPAYDPFTSAAASGGSSYLAGQTLAGQTNALGLDRYEIGTGTSNANSLKATANPLSYLGLTGFSGNEILLTNAVGMGARMFVATNSSDASFIDGSGTNFYYSVILQASNITSLSAVGTTNYVMGMGDQGTIANQTSQPGTLAGVLDMMKETSTNFVLGIAKQANQATFWSSTVLSTNQVYFIVVDYEIVGANLYGSPSGDNVRLWINPATNTFGAPIAPTSAADTSIVGTGGSLTPYISCVQIYDHATNSPNDLYMTAFRMGTNWGWVTGGPGIGYAPLASTNCSTGVLNLSVLALQNGSPNTYNWQFDGTNLANGPSASGSGATVSGATNAALTITGMDTGATQRDSGPYTVVVSNAWGAITSAVSAVTAYSAPVITAQPSPTNLLLYAGETNTIALTAVGFNPVYLWYSNSALVPAVTGTSFVTGDIQTGASIYCVVSNSYGATTSAVVSLAVEPLPTAPYPLAVLLDRPIGFWPLSEGPDNGSGNDGTTSYDYISGDNGFYTNVVLAQTGYASGLASEYGYMPPTDSTTSAGFGNDGINGYVAQIPNINFGANTASSFSVEAWANANGNDQASGAAIVNKGWGGGEQFTLDYTTGWRFYIRNAAAATTIALSSSHTDNNWHHLVGVVDAGHSNVVIYVDGVAQNSVSFTPSGGILSTTNDMVIGSRMSSETSEFNDNFLGDIQNVAVYNYALTPGQVANHYYAAGIGPTVTVPQSTNVNENTTLSVTATATGSPALTYQWYDVTSGSPGTPLTGQTNLTLVINNITAAAYNGHSLDLTVTNIYGQVTSGQLYVTVQSGAPSAITIEPASLAVYAGYAWPLPFTVTAQGSAPFSYQWTTNGENVPNATSAAFSNTNLPPGSYNVACNVGNNDDTNLSPTATLTVVPLPTDAYGLAVLKTTPVAFWRLDEPANASTAYDCVGGHDATYENAINGEPGFIPEVPSETATAFGSNGVAPSIALENNNIANGIPLIDFSTQGANAEFSVELWLQAPPQNGQDIICKGYPNNTQFAIDTDGSSDVFRFVVHNTADTIATAISSASPDGNWHHLVAVCDEANGAVRLYVDGALKVSGTIPAGSGLLPLSSTYPVVIASQEAQGGGSFTGVTNTSLSQVALYAYAMTSNQVAAHYTAGTALPPLAPFSITGGSVVDGTSVTIIWQSVSGYTYQVQAAAALSDATNAWLNIGSPVIATGTSTSYTDTSTNASGKTGYYRVVGY